jgi:ABC-type nitrate/sulfonate/bicarbonate transport system substrate-binding protein
MLKAYRRFALHYIALSHKLLMATRGPVSKGAKAMERSRGAVLLAMVMFLIFVTPAGGQTRKIRMGISALSAGYSVAYIAKDTGLFAKNGLDVEMILIDSGPTVHALIAGDLSVAGVGASRIVASGM